VYNRYLVVPLCTWCNGMNFIRLCRLGWRWWARCLLMKCLLKQDFPKKRYRFHFKIYTSEILDTTTDYQSAIASWFPGFVRPCSRQNYLLIMQWLQFLVNKNALCEDSGTKFPLLEDFELVIWFRNKHCHDGRSFVVLYQIPYHGRESMSTDRIVVGYFTKFCHLS
jgi:hypothetical protein